MFNKEKPSIMELYKKLSDEEKAEFAKAIAPSTDEADETEGTGGTKEEAVEEVAEEATEETPQPAEEEPKDEPQSFDVSEIMKVIEAQSAKMDAFAQKFVEFEKLEKIAKTYEEMIQKGNDRFGATPKPAVETAKPDNQKSVAELKKELIINI